MQIITHKKHPPNISHSERLASVIGGGILTVADGLDRKSVV